MESKNMPPNMKITRRFFGKIFGGIIALFGIFGAGKLASPYIRPKDKILRPPGAENEKAFFGKCIKCGQCVQVCPYHSVKLADIDRGISAGTPYIDPAERGCYLCDLLPCILSCPSEALDHNISLPQDVLMGKAEVVSADTCFGMIGRKVSEEDIARLVAHGAKSWEEKELALKLKTFEGKPCVICKDLCPYPERDDAISIIEREDGSFFPEIKAKCVGCGVCMELCPAEKNVFRIEPL